MNKENQFMEYKQYDESFENDLKGIGKTICAALNSNVDTPFTIYFGINDKGSITGIEEDITYKIIQLIKDTFASSISCINYEHKTDKKSKMRYLVIVITASTLPVMYKGNYYHRVNDKTLKMTPPEISKLYELKNSNIQIYVNESFITSNFTSLLSCVNSANVDDFINWLKSTKHINKNNQVSLYLFQLMNNQTHKISIHNHINGDEIIFDDDFFTSIQNCIYYFTTNILSMTKIIEGKRKKIYDISIEVIRELIVNCFVHSATFPHNTPIIEIDCDKISFVSLGTMDPLIIKNAYNNIRPLSNRMVNKKLIEILSKTQYMEAAGRGFRLLLEDSHPILNFSINSMNNQVCITIYNKFNLHEELHPIVELFNGFIDEINRESLIKLIMENSELSNDDIQSHINKLIQLNWLIERKHLLKRNE